MADVNELRERQQVCVAQARETLDAITPETEEARAKELEESHDKAMAEYDRIERIIEREERAVKAAEKMRAELLALDPAPDGDSGGGIEERTASVATAFGNYLRHGVSGLDDAERRAIRELRAQATSPGADGGFTVPQGFMDELMVSLAMYGPMLDPGVTRQIVTGSGNTIDWPTMDDTSNKGILLGENSEDGAEDLVFGQKQLAAFKYTSRIIRVSEELLQDNEVNIETVISDAMAERLGRIVNEHLTVGTGTNQPAGIVTDSTQGHEAAAAAIDFDDVLDLLHSVDPAYRGMPNVQFMFNDETLKALRKIKDNQDRPLWQPADNRTGEPATIYGFPYVINQDMAGIGAENVSMVFGAFDRYVVRRVREFAVKRLVERYSEFYQIGFLGFGRFDGKLVDTAAVKHLVHADT